jgi:hypothetical protein
MYKAQQASGAAAGAPGGADGASGGGAHGGNTSGQGDVVDAEFVDVDDSKKPN